MFSVNAKKVEAEGKIDDNLDTVRYQQTNWEKGNPNRLNQTKI